MPYVRLPDGTVAHIRVAKARRRLCCGKEGGHPCPTAATLQCDFALGPGRTCDAYICAAHAREVGPDLHHCPTHAGQQAGLFTGLMP